MPHKLCEPTEQQGESPTKSAVHPPMCRGGRVEIVVGRGEGGKQLDQEETNKAEVGGLGKQNIPNW